MKKALTGELIICGGKITVSHGWIEKVGAAMHLDQQVITFEGIVNGLEPLALGIPLENAMAVYEGLGKVLHGMEELRN